MASEFHHRFIEKSLLLEDAQAREFIIGCLGRATFRAEEGNTSAVSIYSEHNTSRLLPGAGEKNGHIRLSRLNASTETPLDVSEEAKAGARAVATFPRAVLERIPTLFDETSAALGAIVSKEFLLCHCMKVIFPLLYVCTNRIVLQPWAPKPFLQEAVNRTVRKWGTTFNASTSIALQVSCAYLLNACSVPNNLLLFALGPSLPRLFLRNDCSEHCSKCCL